LDGIKKGTDAKTVPCEESFFMSTIPDGNGKLTVQVSQAIGSIFFIKMQNDFCIAVGGKAVSPLFQNGTKFKIIKYFSIEDDPQGAIFVGNGLLPTAEVDDAEAGAAKTCMVIQVDSKFIRSPVLNQREHFHHHPFRDGLWLFKIDYSGYSTHVGLVTF